MEKLNLLVLFGGQSTEHEVSCMSCQNVVKAIDTEKYHITLVGITLEGKWLFVDSLEEIANGTWKDSKKKAVLSPDATDHALLVLGDNQVEKISIDVIFPVLHGLYGEDGTVQGIFELAGIPYVGCNVLSSAVSMDKAFTKIVVDALNIRQARYVLILRQEMSDMDFCVNRVESILSYPVFVKPSAAGSSKGVSKAQSREELIEALIEAQRHDSKILVEETIVGREIECAVFSDGTIKSSGVGEILSAEEFYDFDAKYNNSESKTIVDPDLPEEIVAEIKKDAEKIFQAVGGYSLSRVDFFLDEKGIVFNEINTLPGFTAISMYPMLWEARGIGKKELVENLIQSAFSREKHFN